METFQFIRVWTNLSCCRIWVEKFDICRFNPVTSGQSMASELEWELIGFSRKKKKKKQNMILTIIGHHTSRRWSKQDHPLIEVKLLCKRATSRANVGFEHRKWTPRVRHLTTTPTRTGYLTDICGRNQAADFYFDFLLSHQYFNPAKYRLSEKCFYHKALPTIYWIMKLPSIT